MFKRPIKKSSLKHAQNCKHSRPKVQTDSSAQGNQAAITSFVTEQLTPDCTKIAAVFGDIKDKEEKGKRLKFDNHTKGE